MVDNEIFLKIKNKIIQQRASRSGSQIVKDDKDNQDELRKSELCHDSESYPRNGSFVKPKNYHIVEEKCFKSIRISEERKQVSYVVNKQPLILQSTPLVGLASWLSAPTASKLVSISEKSVALTKTSDKPEKCKKRSLL